MVVNVELYSYNWGRRWNNSWELFEKPWLKIVYIYHN